MQFVVTGTFRNKVLKLAHKSCGYQKNSDRILKKIYWTEIYGMCLGDLATAAKT